MSILWLNFFIQAEIQKPQEEAFDKRASTWGPRAVLKNRGAWVWRGAFEYCTTDSLGSACWDRKIDVRLGLGELGTMVTSYGFPSVAETVMVLGMKLEK